MVTRKKGARGNPGGTPSTTAGGRARTHRAEVTRTIRMGADPREAAALTRELIAKNKEYEQLRIKAKDVMAGFRADLKDRKKEIDDLFLRLDKGDPQEVDCIEVKDFKRSLVIYEDKKGVELERREMTDDDRQLGLSEKPAGDGDDGAAGDDDESDGFGLND